MPNCFYCILDLESIVPKVIEDCPSYNSSYPASNILKDDENSWLLPKGVENKGFTLDYEKVVKVKRVQIRNTCA